MKALEKADLFVANGMGMEHFLENVAKNFKNLPVVYMTDAFEEAPSRAGTIDISCGYISDYHFHIGSVYGGANKANINGDILLEINAGYIDNIFGGNNNSGNINGNITVNVYDDENGCGMEVGNVYGCGNLAVYSVYGYDEGTPIKTGTVVNNL